MIGIEEIKARGLPHHVAIIMDGNGRWAEQRGLVRTAGHQAGAQAAERLIRFAGRQLGLRYLTLFAFSVENWNRPPAEVDFLMDLLERFIAEKLEEFVGEGVRLCVSGDVKELPVRVRETIARAIGETAKNDRLNLNIALNYGSRQEILGACQMIARAVQLGELDLKMLDSEVFSKFLYTKDIPDPDLVIRTSGEMRLSNFLLWQAAYSELYFTDTLWPDFAPEELLDAIAVYQERDRRFGAVPEGNVV